MLIKATGVPPHVSILQQMTSLATQVNNILPNFDTLADRVVAGVTQVLEERAIGAGVVTYDGLKEMLSNVLDERLQLRGIELPGGEQNVAGAPRYVAQPVQMHMWGGKFHPVPEDFDLPQGSLLTAYQSWCCGNNAKQYPPLRTISGTDMPTRNLKSRFSDFRFAMGTVDSKV